MGLAYDPNEALKIPNAKQDLVDEARQAMQGNSSESEEEKDVKRVPQKCHVAMQLEAEAKAPRERLFRLPNQQVQFVTYLMDKYADDYKAMSKDKKNYYQMTWRQIRSKINTFKGIPEQYAEYLLKKGDIVLDDPETMEETRKRVAEENVKKYCAPKPKKVKPVVKSKWLGDSDDEMDFDAEDKLEDVTDEEGEKPKGGSGEPEKKLKLFSDDEGEGQDDGDSKKKAKKSKAKSEVAKSGKTTKQSTVPTIETKTAVDKSGKKGKALEILPSSDSESDAELEGDDDDDDDDKAGFVDLDELSDEELSEDDVLDDGKFVTDSDESD